MNNPANDNLTTKQKNIQDWTQQLPNQTALTAAACKHLSHRLAHVQTNTASELTAHRMDTGRMTGDQGHSNGADTAA